MQKAHRPNYGPWFSGRGVSLAIAAGVILSTTLSIVPATAAGASGPISVTGNAAPAPAGAKSDSNLPTLSGNHGQSAAQQAALDAAAAKARKTGQPVVVDELTTETGQVVAQPKGGFAYTGSPKPVRAKRGDGWTEIDTKLHKQADGTLAPAATAYGSVSFSGGGNGPLVVTSSGDTSYSLSWPGALPAPTVKDSTATYAEVLPGVDLVLSPTVAGGFSEVLVVKNAQAAKNPALAKLELAAKTTGGTVSAGQAKDGVVVKGGGALLDTGTPIMWDSNTAATNLAPAQDRAPRAAAGAGAATGPATLAGDASDAAHPGSAARIAVVGTKATNDKLTLVPDAGFLGDGSIVYPAFVDPTFNWHPASANNPAFDEVKQGSPCNGVSLYNNTSQAGNYGQLGVGYNGWSGCYGIERTYYQWNLPTVMWDATVSSATANISKVYSANCGVTATVYLHWAGGIGSGTNWNNQPGYGGALSSAPFGPSYNASYCPNNGYVTHGLDVTGPMQQSASGHWGTFTAALTEDDYENSGDRNGLSRLSDNPSLQIYFNHAPNTPSAYDLSAVTGSDNAGCATSGQYPYIGKTIATNTPVLNARASDPDGDAIQVGYQYWVDGSSNVSTGWSGDNLASGSTGQFSLPSSFISGLTNGQVVDWKATVYDGNAWSGWSPVCHFIAEPTGPDAPFIKDNATYPNTDKGGLTGAASGTAATFQVTGNPDSAAATKVIYGLDQQPATSGTPANQTAPITGGVISTPDGHWLLNDGTGTVGADSGAYGNPVHLNGNAGWSTDAVRGKVLQLNGSTAYASSTYPVIDTNQTFAVSAWVNLSSLTNNSTFVSQSDTAGSTNGFQLYYSAYGHAFGFNKQNSDDTAGNFTAVYGPTSGALAPAANTWTNLVGVYDPATQKMSLYVNGQLAGSTTYAGTNWDAKGGVQIGRRLYQGSYAEYAAAQISDVQLYSWTLDAWDVNTVYDTASFNVTPLAPGPHTLWSASVDVAGDVSGMTAYHFTAANFAPTTCASLTACFNNTAITADHSTGGSGADGATSFSVTDLANAGWNSGQKVTIDGATFTLPAFGSGQADNVLAANQTVTFNQAVPATGNTSLMVLASSTNAVFQSDGAVSPGNAAPYVPKGTLVTGVYCFSSTNPNAYCPANGVITYSDGSKQTYTLNVPDWVKGPAALAAVSLPHRNHTDGTQDSYGSRLYPFSIPLTAGKTVSSITLPSVGNQVGSSLLHVFGLATRNTTTGTAEANGTTVAAPSGQTWTGAWAGPTEGNFNYQGSNFSNQTFRIAVKPAVSGNTVRVKLDDALGTSPLAIGKATVALATGGVAGAVPTATPVPLSFGGVQGVTIPQGGMVYSDPLPFTVTAYQYLIVSFSLTNSVPYLVEHPWSNTAETFVSAPGSGDHTADTTATAFSGTGTLSGWFSDVLTDVDVSTNNIPTRAVIGDGLIDAGQTGSSASNAYTRLAENLSASGISASPQSSTVAEGIRSNQVMKDNPQTLNGGAVGGVSLLSRIDRDVLDQPGLTSVVLQEGIEDLLGGTDANTLTGTGLAQVLGYLQNAGIAMTTVGLTPCDGYAGYGSPLANGCTATVDGYRTTANNWLASGGSSALNQWSTPPLYYADPDLALGAKDTANGETKLAAGADQGDHVNLSLAGYGALQTAIMSAQDTWVLNDGSGTVASDTGASITGDSSYGQSALGLSGGAAFATDATRGNVLTVDGTSGTANSAGQVLNTSGSFSVSAWVKLSATPTHNATVVAQSGTQASGFYLQYHQSDNKWCLMFMGSDTANANGVGASPCAAGSTAPGSWVHLVGVYNAANQTARLYVNGNQAAVGTGITPWAATGSLTVGSSQYNGAASDFFPGSISGLQAWNYTLTAPQVTALYQQLTPVH